MCFLIHPKHNKPKIAKRKIRVYKLLTYLPKNKLRSPVLGHIYEEGLQSTVELKPLKSYYHECKIINQGYHSYKTNKKIMVKVVYYQKNEVINKILYTCYIPKGGIYYYNPETQEYVSNQIIITLNRYDTM